MEENGTIHIQSKEAAEMIEHLWKHIAKLKKQNVYLEFFKKEGDQMFGEDTNWKETASKIIQRIIEANNETITYFDKNSKEVENWLEEVVKIGESF